jgi:hypothetical protein
MTIQSMRPEVEVLINQRLQSGAFKDAEDLILQALRSSSPTTPYLMRSPRRISSSFLRRYAASIWISAGTHLLEDR